MSAGSVNDSTMRERLSALVDGEGQPSDAVSACSAWRDDAACRATWHAYHLIGDALRSDDLASDGDHDARFLTAFRERLAREPIVLAPAPQVAEAAPVHAVVAGVRRWGWRAPSAVAAGFVMVAGALVATREPERPASAAATTTVPVVVTAAALGETATTPLPVAPATATATATVEAPEARVDGQFIRDARLDRYLAAHKQFAGSSALGVPSAFLRSATSDASNR
jgi:sigma-E factor negative regulatory protein RseA